MNTITVQLTDKQFALLDELLGYAHDQLTHLISEEAEGLYLEEYSAEKKGLSEISETLQRTKSYLWSSSCGHIELEIPAEAVDAIAQSGENLPAIEAALQEHPNIAAQLERYDSKVLEEAIRELDVNGIEQVHNMNIRTMHQYLLWSACWDIANERNQED